MSPRGVIPGLVPPGPVTPDEGFMLPYIRMGRLMLGEEILSATIPISVWPTTGTTTDVGLAYDHQGEAPLEYAPLLRTPNARLYINDIRYTIVDIATNEYVPHVALALREMAPML